jgi:RNA polymerase sigma-70 factor (ECF subfamily)
MTFIPSTTNRTAPAWPDGGNSVRDRRKTALPDDNTDVRQEPAPAGDPATVLLTTYDGALPHVYGYLMARCGRAAVAEDLTAETLLAAVDAVRSDDPPDVSVAWLVGVARHKLADHWRRQAREERGLAAVEGTGSNHHDPWEVHLEGMRAQATLERLSPLHRAVLTLRYVDDLAVPDVAALVDRSLHATEGLLVRARAAFRRAYSAQEDPDA